MHGGVIHRIAKWIAKAEGYYTVCLGKGGGCSYPPLIETNNCWTIMYLQKHDHEWRPRIKCSDSIRYCG